MHRMAFLIALLLAVPARACIWDFDTVRDERRGLPDVADVLAGQWERHSAAFYRNRADRMAARLRADPADADAADNLAVAQEKLGDPAAAIATMDAKERAVAGRYTTYANRGTFHIHAGDYAAGIADLKRALAVNPDAHFGREEYLLRLAEYLLAG